MERNLETRHGPRRHHPRFFPLFLCLALLVAALPSTAALAAGDDILLLTSSARMPGLAKSVEQVIYAEGGTVSTGPATLTVPPGALGAGAYVILSGQRPGGAFGPQDATKSYKISLGAPNSQPLTLAIAGFGGADRDVLVALSDAVVDYEGNSNAASPNLLDGQVRGGVLTVTIPAMDIDEGEGSAAKTASGQAPPPLKSAVNTWHEYALWTVSGRNSLRSDHFRVTYPTALVGQSEDYPQLILDHAEAAYALLCAMGYVYADKLNWPMTINVQQDLGKANGYAAIPLSGKRNGYISLNQNLCAPDKLELLKATVGHELFHHVQNTYDPRSGIRIRHEWLKPYFLWLAEASSVWFERRFLDKASYVADIFTENYDMINHGLEMYASHGDAQNTGYFASGFLRYLAETHNESVIRSAWEEVRDMGSGSSQYSDLTALGRGVGTISSLAASWQVYMDKFICGTTGFSGWVIPGSNKTWYAAASGPNQFSSTIGNGLAPFSAERWTLSFNADLGETDWLIRLPDAPADVTFTLFKGPTSQGPFSKVAVLPKADPYAFKPVKGDVYVISVVNANTDAPYTTYATAAAEIGMTGTSTFCPGVPENSWLGLFADGMNRTLKHPTEAFIYADETYYDAKRTKKASATCYNDETGAPCGFKNEWTEEGILKQVTPYNAACQIEGLLRLNYDSGVRYKEFTFVAGTHEGPYREYHPSGALHISGGYSGGKMDGVWIWYADGGSWYMNCSYSAGEATSCVYPDP